MSASASNPSIIPPARAKLSRPPVHHTEPAREGRWGRLLRWLADRRDLLEMDSRLLRDVGLTHEDVRRGVPFRSGAPRPITLIRLGTLEIRNWQIKLYAPVAEAAGLRPEDLAAARRAFRAVLAEPSREPVAGFAVLSAIHDTHLPAGSLALSVCQWDGLELRRCKLLLPVETGPVRRVPDHGFGIAELLLAAGEGLAWQRHADQPSPSSMAAYVAEDCA